MCNQNTPNTKNIAYLGARDGEPVAHERRTWRRRRRACGGGRGPAASLGARFEDIAVFNERAGLLEKKMEQLVGTMQNTQGKIDERLKEIASANKEMSSSTATIAT